MELRDITYTIIDHVAQVNLVRPAAMNAIRPRTIEEFEMLMERLDKSGVRGLVITGVGLVFCSGLDPAMTNGSNASRSFQRLIQALLRQPGIRICAVNGAAIGAGLDLTQACDLCIASDWSTFSFAGSIGPDYSRRNALGPAERWMATGEVFTARQALASNLIDYVVRPEHVLKFALAEARTMTRYSPRSIRMAGSGSTISDNQPLNRFSPLANHGI